MNLVFVVEEKFSDDRGTEYWEAQKIFNQEVMAEEFIKLQDYPCEYRVKSYEIHTSITKFTEAYTLKLVRSALAKLTVPERIALGLSKE